MGWGRAMADKQDKTGRGDAGGGTADRQRRGDDMLAALERLTPAQQAQLRAWLAEIGGHGLARAALWEAAVDRHEGESAAVVREVAQLYRQAGDHHLKMARGDRRIDRRAQRRGQRIHRRLDDALARYEKITAAWQQPPAGHA